MLQNHTNYNQFGQEKQHYKIIINISKLWQKSCKNSLTTVFECYIIERLPLLRGIKRTLKIEQTNKKRINNQINFF